MHSCVAGVNRSSGYYTAEIRCVDLYRNGVGIGHFQPDLEEVTTGHNQGSLLVPIYKV